MHTIAAAVILLVVLFLGSTASAFLPKPEGGAVKGAFEMSGYFSAGMGWQRFSNAPITEWANDGSFAGILGSVLPGVATGGPPAAGPSGCRASRWGSPAPCEPISEERRWPPPSFGIN